jgi:hypothetical protein
MNDVQMYRCTKKFLRLWSLGNVRLLNCALYYKPDLESVTASLNLAQSSGPIEWFHGHNTLKIFQISSSITTVINDHHMVTQLQLNTQPFAQSEKWHSDTGSTSVKNLLNSHRTHQISDITLKYENTEFQCYSQWYRKHNLSQLRFTIKYSYFDFWCFTVTSAVTC